ncbi:MULTISPECIES: hypothetical protein [unclassified Haloferax]|uniref:hypothetical protein n=1 Tax=unclassified Haloferax TaxID=2625095 RepID=UPI0028747959|nr:MULTISPECIES: hypothetical protein [unclassified Haloferax]MDS0243951.1 hypothetical protein [Haloferax sp. S2CR25]MDS0447072.1 hypothetical protein [Haloferax sp. S2CR25-2]
MATTERSTNYPLPVACITCDWTGTESEVVIIASSPCCPECDAPVEPVGGAE